ncbi:hypothetical protein [Nonomuraea sp. bgisy101]|uniref:DUF1146 domain-containing protein n=1 Tax=Nonomuraea mangrovi TaxID=2316207 RepID=A0ABW4TFG3_9ACTN
MAVFVLVFLGAKKLSDVLMARSEATHDHQRWKKTALVMASIAAGLLVSFLVASLVEALKDTLGP